MGILNWIGLGKELAKPIEAIGGLYTTDKERLKAQKEIEEVLQKPALEQIKLNSIFASSKSFFNSGYIPMTGWTMGFLILIFFGPYYTVTSYLWAKMCLMDNKFYPFPISSHDVFYLVGVVFGFNFHSLFKKD